MEKTKPSKNKFQITKYLNYIILVAVLILITILGQANVLTSSDRSTLTRIAFSMILAVSLNLVVGFLGELSLGHAGFMCVGAYIGCYFANYFKTVVASPLVVLIVAALVGGVVAAAFGFIIGLPALRLRGDYLAIATLAFGEIVRCVFKNLEGFGGALGLTTDLYDSKTLYIISFVILIIVVILCENLIHSKHGRAVTAIRDNEIAAKAMGINVTFYKLFIFMVAAFFAGIAGVIYGETFGLIKQDKFSYNYSIEILVMVVLGGMGSINGSMIAAAVITYVNIKLQNELSGELAPIKSIVYAIILIFIILWNNADFLKPFKSKYSFQAIKERMMKKKEAGKES